MNRNFRKAMCRVCLKRGAGLCLGALLIATPACRQAPPPTLEEGAAFKIGDEYFPAAPEDLELERAPQELEESTEALEDSEIVEETPPASEESTAPAAKSEDALSERQAEQAEGGTSNSSVKRIVAEDDINNRTGDPATSIQVERPPQKEASRRIPELQSIYFNYNSYELSPEAISQLERIAEYLDEHPDLQVQIQGNTDERGTTEYNYNLGEKRANQIREWLIEHGVNPARLFSLSFGEENPVKRGQDEESWRENRRVDFFVY